MTHLVSWGARKSLKMKECQRPKSIAGEQVKWKCEMIWMPLQKKI